MLKQAYRQVNGHVEDVANKDLKEYLHEKSENNL